MMVRQRLQRLRQRFSAGNTRRRVISVSLAAYLGVYLLFGIGGVSFPFQAALAGIYAQSNTAAPSGSLWVERSHLHYTNGSDEFTLNQTASYVADWHFDEGTGQTINDYHAWGPADDGYRGEGSGSESKDPTWVAGKFDDGLNWSGNDQVVTTPYTDSGTSLYADQGLTVSVWVKWVKGSSDNWPRIVTTDCSENWCMIVDNGGNNGGQDVRWSANFDSGGEIIYTDSSISDGNWHHLVGVYDPAVPSLRVYVDGGLEEVYAGGNIDGGGIGTGTTRILHIGCGTESSSFPGTCQGGAGATEFRGRIDEPRVIDRALYGQEVRMLAAGGSTLPSGGSAGSLWIEGTDLHWIDANGYEQVYNGTIITRSPGGSSGSLWMEDGAIHYIDANGHERATFAQIMEDWEAYPTGSEPVDYTWTPTGTECWEVHSNQTFVANGSQALGNDYDCDAVISGDDEGSAGYTDYYKRFHVPKDATRLQVNYWFAGITFDGSSCSDPTLAGGEDDSRPYVVFYDESGSSIKTWTGPSVSGKGIVTNFHRKPDQEQDWREYGWETVSIPSNADEMRFELQGGDNNNNCGSFTGGGNAGGWYDTVRLRFLN